MLFRLAFLFALILPLPAAAQTLQGNWAFGVDDVDIFQIRIERAAGDEGDWEGAWLRPKSFASNGVIFRGVTGPPVEVPSSRSGAVGEWVEFTFDDPRPGAVPDVFLIRVLPDGTAEAIYVETGFAPFVLRRVLAGEPVGPWDPGITYQRPGMDLASAGPPVLFSSGATSRPSTLDNVVESQLPGPVTPAPPPILIERQVPVEKPAEAPVMLGR